MSTILQNYITLELEDKSKIHAISFLDYNVKMYYMSQQHDLWFMIYSKANHNDVYFSIPNVHYLYKWHMICKVQTCDKILAQLSPCNNSKNVLSSFFGLCPAKENPSVEKSLEVKGRRKNSERFIISDVVARLNWLTEFSESWEITES